MDRRAFVTGLGAVLAAPLGAEAQQTMRRIGVLGSVRAGMQWEGWEGFENGLKELGYAEGRNIVVEWRWTEGKAERAAEVAAELVRLKPAVIVTSAPQPTAALKAATETIPIVFLGVADPVGTGLVASLARPGGNITGIATIVPEAFASKMVELLHDAVPQASRIAILTNPTNAVHRRIVSTELPTTAERLRVTFLMVEAKAAGELNGAFEQAARLRAEAITVMGDPLIFVNRAHVVGLAVKYRLPALYFFREVVKIGGLMAYGPSFYDLGRRLATFVDKILKGAKPADLPVEQPAKFELVINLKTAKALGLTVPQSLLLRADQIIE